MFIYIYKILRLAALRLLILFRLPQLEPKVKISKGDRSDLEGVLVFLANIPRSRKILRLAALLFLVLFRLPQPEAKLKASRGDRSYIEGVFAFLANIPRSCILISDILSKPM